MNEHNTSVFSILDEDVILSEREWQLWLKEYTTLRGEAFLRILKEREKKISQWKIS